MEEQEDDIMELLSTERTDLEFELCQKRSKLCQHPPKKLAPKGGDELWSSNNFPKLKNCEVVPKTVDLSQDELKLNLVFGAILYSLYILFYFLDQSAEPFLATMGEINRGGLPDLDPKSRSGFFFGPDASRFLGSGSLNLLEGSGWSEKNFEIDRVETRQVGKSRGLGEKSRLSRFYCIFLKNRDKSGF